MAKDFSQLRKGFTTGACVATAMRVAYKQLINEWTQSSHEDVLFPDGEYRAVNVDATSNDNDQSYAMVIKDAGDDPDVTHQAHISTTLFFDDSYNAGEHDHVLTLGSAIVIVTVAEGVGVATREGLDVPVGKWAINPGPLKMITDNLCDCGIEDVDKSLVVSITVENGEEISKKTLNSTLGIIGGISILGTTGIVYPYSHSAYRDSVNIHIRYADVKGFDTIAVCTGTRTQNALYADFPEFEEGTVIRIGDFIADTLTYAGEKRFKKIIVGCMPGKLFKYAQGHENTHAHKKELNTEKLRPVFEEAGVAEKDIAASIECPTVREAIECIPEKLRMAVFDLLAKRALVFFNDWTGNRNDLICEIRCYSAASQLIGVWS